MSSLPIYQPSDASGTLSMTYFHALARLGMEGIIRIEPEVSFVSVGYFDRSEAVVDLAACKGHALPIIRREVGGGPVLLGPGQVFYQIVLNRSNSLVPSSIDEAYRRFSIPIIDSYGRLGVEATYRPINDLVAVSGKKISGQGAADIEDHLCFVGAILRYFDVGRMAQVLRVPDEKFRDKFYKTLEDNIFSVRVETGNTPPPEVVKAILQEEFSKMFGRLEPSELPAEVVELAHELSAEFGSDASIYAHSPKSTSTSKVRDGVELHFGLYKAPGGLVRAETSVGEGKIVGLSVSGDFTYFPKAAFEPMIEGFVGSDFAFEPVVLAIRNYLEQHGIDCPGVTAEHFAHAIVTASPDEPVGLNQPN